VKAITAWLDEPMHTFENYPKRRTERVAVQHPDGTVTWQPTGERKPAHYRGWSLTLPKGETLTDDQWEQVAEAFMAKMGFHGRGSDAPCRWLIVNHGKTGSQGLEHIHIAGNIVAEDGSLWNDYNDRPRSQAACDEVAQELLFERDDGTTFQLSRVDGQAHKRGQRGFVKGELESDYARGIDIGDPVADTAGEPRRTRHGRMARIDPATARPQNGTRRTLERIVSEAAKAARDEIDFVALLRAEGLRVRPRFEKGGERVVGYSVAFKGRGEPWFSGTRLGHDLKLTAIRAAGNWPELDPRTVSEVWNNPRARAPLPPGTELLARAQDGLAQVDSGDQVTWAHAARDAAAILNTWSLRIEPTPGPIADAAYALRASATIHRTAGDRRRWLAAQAGRDACNALLGHRPARTSKELVRQVSQLVHAIAALEGLGADGLAPPDARPMDPAFEITAAIER
jgi:hypothetical protein